VRQRLHLRRRRGHHLGRRPGAALSALACALGLTAGGLFGVQRFMATGGNHLCNRRLVAVRADETQKVAA
jgi:hypothetical protein